MTEDELLEASLPKPETDEISALIRGVDGVKDLHHLRTRKIGSEIAVDVHVKMDGSLSLTEAHDIATRVEKSLHERYGSGSVITIHMEPYHPR